MNMKYSRAMFLAAAACAAAFQASAARIGIGETVLPTYMFSDPDPVPAPTAVRYPYFRFDGYEAKPSDRAWKSVTLESDRLVVTVFPEVGGKIWGAVDKKTGVDFVYYNHVAKFRDISMRGPWSSGGIEFNFGKMGHEPYVSSPVDWTVRTNEDGSVSCFVGCTEWLCRTFWQVEIRLADGEDGFTTHTKWFNGSGLRQTYYQWMNAAFHGGGDTRYFYPGANWIGHNGDAHPWPVEDGHDLSVYSQNDVPGRSEDHRSMHVINGDARYLGVWWPHLKAGALHENRTDTRYGRKIWMWGLSRQGAIWEGLLTDSDGPYVELQPGRCFQQPSASSWRTPFKYASFAPGGADTFSESWSVVRDEAEFGKLDVRSDIKPRPVEMPADFDWTSAYGLFLRGGQRVLSGGRGAGLAAAERYFKASLAVEPCFAPALDALAALYVAEARDGEARPLLDKALAVNTYDPEANYLDGLVRMAEGDRHTARERFGLAAYSPEYRSAAMAMSARLSLAEGRWDEAAELAVAALGANSGNLDAVAALVAAKRLGGDTAEAARMCSVALAAVPLSHHFAYEMQLCGGGGDFMENVRNEFPDKTVVELALWYETSGLYGQALALYERAPRSIVAQTRAAHLAGRIGDAARARELLAAAEKLPVGMDFPFRRESMPAVEWASRESRSWKFRYLAALMYAACGREAESHAILRECEGMDEVGALLFRASCLGGKDALRDIEAAKGLEDSWRIGMALCKAHADADDWAAARKALSQYVARFPGKPGLELNYARSLVKTGAYREAVDFLDGVAFLPSELGEKPMSLYHEALGALADAALLAGDEAAALGYVKKALAYPETLGAGRPYRLDALFNSWPERVREFCRSRQCQ